MLAVARSVPHRAFERLFARPFSQDVVRGYSLASLGPEPGGPRLSSERPQNTPTPYLRYGLISAGVAMVITSAVLTALYADTTIDRFSASQLDQQRLADRANGFVIGASIGLGLGLASFGWALFAD